MLIPEGKYKGEIRGSHALRFTKSTKKGTDQVELDMRFGEGPAQGEIRRWVGFFSTAAVDRTIGVLRALYPRWRSDSLRDLIRESETEPARVEVELVVEHEPFERKDGSRGMDDRIAFVNVGGGFGEPMDDGELADLDSRMRTTVAAVKQTNAVPAAPTAPAANGQRATGHGRDDFGDAPPRDDRDQPPRGGHPFGGGRG